MAAPRKRAFIAALLPCALLAGASPALAKDVGKLGDAPLRVDVTETALLNWHGDNLNATRRLDDNYGEWINRFNVLMAWKAWQVGMRFDTVKYWNDPHIDEFTRENGYTAAERNVARQQLPHRYRDTALVQGNLSPGAGDVSVFPSKFWASYIKPKLELTLGDAYVAFGRGMVLNIRKFDEIGADTTLQGTKAIFRLDPLTFTAVAGLTNPTRVDDATGFKLQDANVDPDGWTREREKIPTDNAGNALPYRQTWSRDMIVGARVEGRIKTSTLGVHHAWIRRRHDLFTDDPSFVRDVLGTGASIAIPKISDAFPLNVYAEIAHQHRQPFPERGEDASQGYGAYTALSLTTGPVTTTLEGKHYRHMNPVRLNADKSKYTAFQAVQYTANPTVELITQDSLFDNSCTTGGRGRVDVKGTPDYTFFGSVGQFSNWGVACGAQPTLGLTPATANGERHDITDLYAGFDLRSSKDTSYLTVMFGTRRETNVARGESYYREGWIQANGSKTLVGLFSAEIDMWHRNRYLNLEQWREGQTYLAFKYTSKYSVVFGHEYSTRPSQITPPNVEKTPGDPLNALRFLPTEGVQHFLNVGGQIKFGDDVMLRFLFGEQRAALKCVSGVCRFFPAFAGLRTELIVRY